ncbi:MAG TPA: hypothetical protein VGC97_16545, partial [Pyrinomonadaceae bacterium]
MKKSFKTSLRFFLFAAFFLYFGVSAPVTAQKKIEYDYYSGKNENGKNTKAVDFSKEAKLKCNRSLTEQVG